MITERVGHGITAIVSALATLALLTLLNVTTVPVRHRIGQRVRFTAWRFLLFIFFCLRFFLLLFASTLFVFLTIRLNNSKEVAQKVR